MGWRRGRGPCPLPLTAEGYTEVWVWTAATSITRRTQDSLGLPQEHLPTSWLLLLPPLYFRPYCIPPTPKLLKVCVNGDKWVGVPGPWPLSPVAFGPKLPHLFILVGQTVTFFTAWKRWGHTNLRTPSGLLIGLPASSLYLLHFTSPPYCCLRF